ncbi:MAG: 3-isopropylmalate dehydratase small subunit [Salinicola sp.]|nr:3-isopropylmalate dehydratase small subunit [Salinicola sp.]
MSLTIIEGKAYPLGLSNVDTDVIIGSDWLKTVSKEGLGNGCFAALREGNENVFNDPRYAGAEILVAGANFGCGSSREHAAWALADMGVRAIIASSFSDIFSSNAFKNGILAATVDEAAIAPLVEAARDGDLKVDLLQQTVSAGASLEFDFTIDSFRRRCLIEGLNEIELSLLDAEFIIKHEQRVAGQTPWLARAGTA